MKTIGEKIAELRKEKKLTQDAFAAMIGVSSQSISKWENDVTMPDIMLLPVLADVFGITIDELFSIEHTPTKKSFPYEEIPSAVYDEILNTAWQNVDPDFTSKVKYSFSISPGQHSGFVSQKAGGVYANRDLALAFLPSYQQANSLLDSEEASSLLLTLADKTCRELLKYQAIDPGRSFTSASAAAKTGISEEKVTEALEKLVRYHFTDEREVDVGPGESLKIYQMYGKHKMLLLVFPLLSLAERLSDFKENWYGFRG